MRRLRLSALALSLVVLIPTGAEASESPSPIYDTYGEIGMLDMPSAHMAPDGELAFTVGDVGNSQRYALSFQALPWLSTSFRYSHIVGLHSGYNDWNYYDRSFGLKIRLFKEGSIIPDISVGIRDLLGTGLYSAEYLNFSKHVGDFDLTAGLGWGRLGESGTLSNPLGVAFNSFKTRNASHTTGVVNLGQFFHGNDAGIFGGIAWQTPINGLTALAEYSSDRYHGYVYPGGIKYRSPVNIGISYRPFDALALSAGWFYGTTYGFTVSLNGDAKTTASTEQRLGPDIPQPVIRTAAERQEALRMLLDKNPWRTASDVDVLRDNPPSSVPSRTQDLIASLLTEGQDVRDVDMDGKTLIVDAVGRGDPIAQCRRIAGIASASGAHFTAIAMSDLQGTSGLVTFCPVAVRASLVRDDGQKRNPTRENAFAPTAFESKLKRDIAKQDLLLEGVSIKNGELWLYYDNFHYRTEAEALGRIARVLMADAPPSVELFHLTAMIAGLPAEQVSIARSALERTVHAYGSGAGLEEGAITYHAAPLGTPGLTHLLVPYPRFSWSFDPKLAEHIFDPSRPLQFQFYGQLAGTMQLSPGLTLGTVLTGDIWNNLTFSRPPGSALPHVRTDLLKYLKEGQYGISFLGATYRARLTPHVFVELKAGYLEDMFMGVGGDVLWRPENSRFAFGADLYQVWQRDFNRLFGIRHYQILTGHVSVYYRSPWHGLNFKVHVGRYLAGDYGATFEVSRRFSTGVEVGFYATFTNVPFKKFGEGSFDKGIFLHIPLEWNLPIFTQASYDLRLSSLTRDGGQRLVNDDSLYEETRRTSDDEIAQHFDEIVTP